MANIYVVDDDEQLLRMVGLMLQRGGHSPTLISNPVQGLERIKADKPDMAILDVMMPGLSGHDLCRQLRQYEGTKSLPVLILTARAQEVDRQTALQSGADDYLSKPVTSQELLRHVEDLLSRRSRPDEIARQPMVIGVYSMQGGVGRTTLAVNLALSLRRVTQENVCLVDFSTSGGQAAMHLRLQSRSGWADLLTNSSLDWNVIRNNMMVHKSGLHVLPAPAMPQAPTRPTTEMTQELLAVLRSNMLFTIVDLPAVLSASVKATLNFADMGLHVLNPDVVSVQTAVRTDRTLMGMGILPNQRSHILNHRVAEASLSKDTIERGLNSRIPFEINHDTNQMVALSQGNPLAAGTVQSPLPITTHIMATALWQKVTSMA